MTLPLYGLFALLIVAFAVFRLFFYRPWRRRRVSQQPFPQEWDRLLADDWPLYRRLSGEQRDRLQQRILIFLDEKTFYGCAGQEVTDHHRCLIAAQACLLTLNMPTDSYDALQSILLYPGAYRTPVVDVDESGVRMEETHAREGESWENGRIVLSWQDVLHGAEDDHDGFNLVLHEFAHQLDAASGSANGAPVLHDSETAKHWYQAFSKAFKKHCHEVEHHHHTLIDPYGATNPAEFFAVLTELFFEKPGKLERVHPELFELLADFYRIDPREWEESFHP
ncbi:zinc-dependent peptidase [Marinobacteraceae bacterium S3BR75-40.1]